MKKKISAGIVLITTLPNQGKVAILQIRGEFNHEKMGPESWPGACQLSAHGQALPDENTLSALKRETKEELGEKIAKLINKKSIKQIRRKEDLVSIVENYALEVPPSAISNIRLGPSSGGLRLLPLNAKSINKIVYIKNFNKKSGVPDKNITAMFPDEKETLQALI